MIPRCTARRGPLSGACQPLPRCSRSSVTTHTSPEVYRTALRVRAETSPALDPAVAPSAVLPLEARVADALAFTATAVGWPILVLAIVGIWRVWSGGLRDRAVFVVAAWAVAYVTFLGVAVMRVDAPFSALRRRILRAGAIRDVSGRGGACRGRRRVGVARRRRAADCQRIADAVRRHSGECRSGRDGLSKGTRYPVPGTRLQGSICSWLAATLVASAASTKK